jgi:hypothetical protein
MIPRRMLPGLLATLVSNKSRPIFVLLLLLGDTGMAMLAWFLVGVFFQ